MCQWHKFVQFKEIVIIHFKIQAELSAVVECIKVYYDPKIGAK